MGMAYLFLPLWDRQKDTNQYRSKQHGLVGSWYHASYIHKSMSIRFGIIGPAMRWKQTHVPSQTLGDLATISPWWGVQGIIQNTACAVQLGCPILCGLSSQFDGALDVKVRRALVDEKAVEILGDSNMCELVPVVLFTTVIWNPSSLMTIVTPKR